MNSRNPRPSKIRGAKLRAIRNYLELTQTQMLARVAPEMDAKDRARVSMWERGSREPYIEVLLRYADLVQINIEILLRDDLELPAHIIGTGNGSASRRGRPAQTDKSDSVQSPESITKSSEPQPNDDLTTEPDAIQPDDSATLLNTVNDNEDQTPINSMNSKSNSSDNSPQKQSVELYEPEPRESITVSLRSALLDRLTVTHLDILRTVPRHLHKSLSLEELIAICLTATVNQHLLNGDTSFLAQEVAAYVNKFAD